MGILRRKKEPDEVVEHAKRIAEAETMRPEPVPSGMGMGMGMEGYYSLGRTALMINDEAFTEMLLADPELKHMYPAFSQLNRTTQIGDLDRELLDLDYEALILIFKMNMDEDLYESIGWGKLEALKIFARYMMNDPYRGFKAKVLTEQIKVVKTEVETKKRGWLPF